MTKSRMALAATLVGVAALEINGIFTGADTISGFTADVFHTSTDVGAWIFGAVWVAFAAWFLAHVVTFRRPRPAP